MQILLIQLQLDFQNLNFKINYMSVLIFIDQSEGHIKKASLEALSYGAKVADNWVQLQKALYLGTVNDDLAALGNMD